MARTVIEAEMRSWQWMSKANFHLTDAMRIYVAENEHHDHRSGLELAQMLAEIQQRMLM